MNLKTAIILCLSSGAVCFGKPNLQVEIPTIRIAAERNGIKFGSDDWYLILAIRLQENGKAGCEFGIKHSEAWDTNLDTQAGWAAKTVFNQHKRFGSNKVTSGYVNSLADRYCPKESDFEGNANWKKNVWLLFNKLRGEK